MGLFSLLSHLAQDSHDGAPSDDLLTCEICEREVDAENLIEGECEDCYDSDYTGPKYCCGMIYEEGEDSCSGCGEPL